MSFDSVLWLMRIACAEVLSLKHNTLSNGTSKSVRVRVSTQSHESRVLTNKLFRLPWICKFEYANILMQNIQNPLWKDVLKHRKKSFKKILSCRRLFLSECIHYKMKIISTKKKEEVILRNGWIVVYSWLVSYEYWR